MFKAIYIHSYPTLVTGELDKVKFTPNMRKLLLLLRFTDGLYPSLMLDLMNKSAWQKNLVKLIEPMDSIIPE